MWQNLVREVHRRTWIGQRRRGGDLRIWTVVRFYRFIRSQSLAGGIPETESSTRDGRGTGRGSGGGAVRGFSD